MMAMAAPYNDSAGASGMSPRLGNVIDSWYFSALGSPTAGAHLISLTCQIEPSLAKYLGGQLKAVSLKRESERAAHILAQAKQQLSWGIYSYATIHSMLPELRNDLRAVLRSYAHTHPLLGQQEYEGGARHLVVHYRLGDFVGLGYCVSVASLAQVQLSLLKHVSYPRRSTHQCTCESPLPACCPVSVPMSCCRWQLSSIPQSLRS